MVSESAGRAWTQARCLPAHDAAALLGELAETSEQDGDVAVANELRVLVGLVARARLEQLAYVDRLQAGDCAIEELAALASDTLGVTVSTAVTGLIAQRIAGPDGWVLFTPDL